MKREPKIGQEHYDGPSRKGHTQPRTVCQNPRYCAKLPSKITFSPKHVIYIVDSHLWQCLRWRIFPKSKIIYIWHLSRSKAKHHKQNLEGGFPQQISRTIMCSTYLPTLSSIVTLFQNPPSPKNFLIVIFFKNLPLNKPCSSNAVL
jgi:hypothetical protein